MEEDSLPFFLSLFKYHTETCTEKQHSDLIPLYHCTSVIDKFSQCALCKPVQEVPNLFQIFGASKICFSSLYWYIVYNISIHKLRLNLILNYLEWDTVGMKQSHNYVQKLGLCNRVNQSANICTLNSVVPNDLQFKSNHSCLSDHC